MCDPDAAKYARQSKGACVTNTNLPDWGWSLVAHSDLDRYSAPLNISRAAPYPREHLL